MKGYWTGLFTGIVLGVAAYAYCNCREECLPEDEETIDQTSAAAFYSGYPGSSPG